jgi:hypothetical protein
MKKYLLLMLSFLFSVSVVNAKTTDLYEMMKENAKPDNEASEFVSSNEGIDFNLQSGETNGRGIYTLSSTLDDEYPIYYYRGSVNNNVTYKGFCWQIIRTTETGGIKLLYLGKLKADGSCPTGGEDVWVGQSKFGDTTDSYNAGYMYSLPSESEANLHDSPLKIVTDTWFEENMLDYLDDIEDTVYCNDRSRVQGETDFYSSNNRLNPANGNKVSPSLECSLENDRFTVSSEIGNGKLKYPVGNITADEVALAGAVYEVQNSDSYIFVNKFWSMTPHSATKALYPNSLGALNRNNFNYSTGVRPVISLKAAYFNSGDGSLTTPYTITERTYDIVTNPNVLAALSTDLKEAKVGDTVTISIKNISKGYVLGEVVISDTDGNKLDIELKDLENGNFEFVMPESDLYIDVILTSVNPRTADNAYIIVIILVASAIFSGVLYTLRKGINKFE